MTITELRDHGLTPAIAYIVGMTCVLYKEKRLGDVDYLVGGVNHNQRRKKENDVLDYPNKSDVYASESELLEHFTNVKDFIEKNNISIKILSNSGEANGIGSICNKNGFAILIEKNSVSTAECKTILFDIICKISESDNDEIKRFFIRGCYDGRSSLDWNKAHTKIRYLSLDIDRDYRKQEIIKIIATSLNLVIDLNNRNKDDQRNDQIRILPISFGDYLRKIGFFSVFRKRVLNTANINKE